MPWASAEAAAGAARSDTVAPMPSRCVFSAASPADNVVLPTTNTPLPPRSAAPLVVPPALTPQRSRWSGRRLRNPRSKSKSNPNTRKCLHHVPTHFLMPHSHTFSCPISTAERYPRCGAWPSTSQPLRDPSQYRRRTCAKTAHATCALVSAQGVFDVAIERRARGRVVARAGSAASDHQLGAKNWCTFSCSNTSAQSTLWIEKATVPPQSDRRSRMRNTTWRQGVRADGERQGSCRVC